MGEFFLFVLILFVAGWGSAFLYQITRRLSGRVGPGEAEGEATLLLREELESLAARLGRVEDELDFYKRLKAPDEPGGHPRLPAPEDPDS